MEVTYVMCTTDVKMKPQKGAFSFGYCTMTASEGHSLLIGWLRILGLCS